MARVFRVASLGVARIAQDGRWPAIGAARRRVGAWRAQIVAAFRAPELATPEDYERELRERVFRPPQP